MHELVKESGSEVEIEHIYGLQLPAAIHGRQFRTLAAAFFLAITVTRGAEA
jgi:hypothetical protein